MPHKQPIYTPSSMEGSCGRTQKRPQLIQIMHPESNPFRGSGGERTGLGRGPAFNDHQSYAIRTCVKPTQVAACYVVWGMARLERR